MIRKLLLSFFIMVSAVLALGTASKVMAQDCGFSTSTNDTAWVFSANAGSSQTRALLITNTTNSTIAVSFSLSGTDAFGVTPGVDTLAAGDTVTVYIVYHPGSNATSGSHQSGSLVMHRLGSDCHTNLGVYGTVTGNNNGGGNNNNGDAVGVFDPHNYNFGTLHLNTDTCHVVYFQNRTGHQIVITDWHFLHNNGFTVSPQYSQNVTLDSGAILQFTICYAADSLHLEEADSLRLTYHGANDSTNHYSYATFVGHTTRDNNNGGGGNGGGNSDSTNVLYANEHTLNFGSIPLDSTSCRQVTVYNADSTTIAIITGWNTCESPDFSISPSFSGNDTLLPGHSITFTICYTPDSTHASASCKLTLHYITHEPNSDGHTVEIALSGTRANSNNGGGGNHEACIRFEQGDGYRDAVVQGASANRIIYLINSTGAPITISRDSIGCADAAAFAITTSMPLTIPAHTIDTLRYTFTPFTVNGSTKEHYEACGLFFVSGDSITCDLGHVTFAGVSTHDGAGHNDDSVVRPLFPNSGEPRTISIQSSGDNPTKTFTFSNNLSVDVTVSAISIDQKGSFFSIQAIHPESLPFILHPGDQFAVTVAFSANDNNVHTAKLKVTASHTITDVEYDMQGIHTGSISGVKEGLPASVSISMVPNPMSTSMAVTIGGVRSAMVEIYDLLGNELVSSSINSNWNWNGMANGAKVAAGTYIVRFSGVTTGGEAFVASRRVVVTN